MQKLESFRSRFVTAKTKMYYNQHTMANMLDKHKHLKAQTLHKSLKMSKYTEVKSFIVYI